MAQPAEHDTAEEDLYGLTPEDEAPIRAALAAGDSATLKRLAARLHAADLADLLSRLEDDEREHLVRALAGAFNPEVLPYLEERVREGVLEAMGAARAAAAVAELDTDDALLVVEELDPEDRREILAAIPAAERLILEQGLTFPEYSAGRLMQRELVAVPQHWNVGLTIDFLRLRADLPEDFHTVYVVDPAYRPVGELRLSRLLRAKRPVPLSALIDTDIRRIPADTDQEEVARVFRRYGLVAAPVVDDGGRLIGVITVDDVVDVIDEEAEEDMLKLSGVSEASVYDNVWAISRSRIGWLLVNLLTAALAAVVIAIFEAAIEAVVALAILMPIVASLGGNAGTQALTVAVRALALRELTPANALRVIRNELTAGLLNGMILAVLVGAGAWLLFGEPMIGAVIALAVTCNLCVAGFAGATIPFAMERAGIDPAVASAVFLTAVTDWVGFFVFLGLGAWLLL